MTMAIDPTTTAAKGQTITIGPSTTTRILIYVPNGGGGAVAQVQLCDPSGAQVTMTSVLVSDALPLPGDRAALRALLDKIHVFAAGQLGFA